MDEVKTKREMLFAVFTHLHAFVILQIISNDISELQKNQATTVAKIAQYKRKLMDLSHRVLQVQTAVGFLALLKKKTKNTVLHFFK